jgi:hypothetical protein
VAPDALLIAGPRFCTPSNPLPPTARLDGNEYTGRAEFEVVERLCRPHFLALHDCSTLKTRAVEAYLAARPNEWQRVSSGSDKAAWAIYENRLWRP